MAVVGKSNTEARYLGRFMANRSQQMTWAVCKVADVEMLLSRIIENTPSSDDDRVS